MFENLIINNILAVSLRHKCVSEAKYQNRTYTNAQNNNGYLQVNIDTDGYFQLLRSVTHQPLTLTLNMDIIGFPKKDYNVLNAQSDAAQTAFDIIAYLERQNSKYLSIYDYSLLCIDEFTDDKSAGVRLTLETIIPKPVDFCSLQDNFDEEEPIVEEKDINVKGDDDRSEQDITLRPKFIL